MAADGISNRDLFPSSVSSEMAPDSGIGTSAACSPAPYGRACAGCTRAKSKCFYRSDGSACERCHRLRKACEPASVIRKRKRKAQTPLPSAQPPVAPTRLEEKLDDLVTLLRSQAVEKHNQTPIQHQTPQLTGRHDSSTSPTPAHQNPDIMLDTTSSVVHLLRPVSPHTSPSPIIDDISFHKIPAQKAEEQLGLFRRAFVGIFPFVHIPTTTSAAELRWRKPFLWLVMMSLTTKMVSEQFSMEETIWYIISRRIISQHLVDMDLLLGVICFASWSHYFKKEKPFMCMLTQLAISLAFELGVQNDAPTNMPRRSRLLVQQPARQRYRTMEERRTILALYHLTSSTWSAYRKTEPLRWTPYMDECLRLLYEGNETHLDILLATQVKCQIIAYQLTCPSNVPAGGEGSNTLSTILSTALLAQLGDSRQSLPAQVGSDRNAQFYLYYTDVKIRESLLSQPRASDQTGVSNFRRLQDLDLVLSSIERWLAVFFAWPISDWVGVNVDIFSQFTQCLVVLFKLTILDEPGWDLEEVRRRADVFGVLDRLCELIDQVPETLGIIDADGPRRGLFFKTTHILRTIKALFLAEMPPNMSQSSTTILATPGSSNGMYNTAAFLDASLRDDSFLGMMHEDILASTWDFRPDGSFVPFAD